MNEVSLRLSRRHSRLNILAMPEWLHFLLLIIFLPFFAKKILLTNWDILSRLFMDVAGSLMQLWSCWDYRIHRKKVCNKNKLVRRTSTNPRDHCSVRHTDSVTIAKPYLDLVSNAFWSKILVGWHSDAPPLRQYVFLMLYRMNCKKNIKNLQSNAFFWIIALFLSNEPVNIFLLSR